MTGYHCTRSPIPFGKNVNGFWPFSDAFRSGYFPVGFRRAVHNKH